MSKCGMKKMDKGRPRNQFTRSERQHLLSIMKEYGQKLEDKNLSILARKELWSTIERKFQDGGFNDRTTAQLKKYWQNYKYHNGRNKWRKENAGKQVECLSKQVKHHDNSRDLSHDTVKPPAVIISDATGSLVTVSVIQTNESIDKLLAETKKSQLEDDTKCKSNIAPPEATKSTENYSQDEQSRENNIEQYSVQSNDKIRGLSHNPNFHVIRQLQLLRQLEAEEHRLKIKLAEMTVKETRLKILHMKEKCDNVNEKYTI